MIQYTLTKRDFLGKKAEKTYVASVTPVANVSTEALYDQVAARAHVSPHMVRMVIEELKEVLAKEIAEGNGVNIEGLGAFKPSIKGIFNPEERIAADDITINTSLRVSQKLIKKINALAHPQRATTAVDAPTITRVSDNTTGSEDEVIANDQGQYVVMVEGVLPKSTSSKTEVIALDAQGNPGKILDPTTYQSTCLRDHFNQENRLLLIFPEAITQSGDYLICYVNKGHASTKSFRLAQCP